MKESSFLRKLEEKTVNAEDLSKEAIRSKDRLQELLNGISSSKSRVKFQSAKVLRIVSEKHPELLYPNWMFFRKLLDSENSILKWNALDIIANLTAVDSDDNFERLFTKFYGYMDEGSLITAGHVIDSSGKIARVKPKLQGAITKKLLLVEKLSVPTAECRNILIGKAIGALGSYQDKMKDRREVVSFVKRQLSNPRRSTQIKAQKLLEKMKELP